MIRAVRTAILAVPAAAFLSACGGEGSAEDGEPVADQATLTGTVTYRERMALPINAVLTVRLQDVSRADAPALLLAQQDIPTQGKSVPISFSLDYDPARIDERMTYAVRAEIRGADGSLLWITDTVHPVLTRGAPADGVEVLMVRAAN